MKFKAILNKIKKDTWWSEEAPSNYQNAIPAWRSFVLHGSMLGIKAVTLCLALYKNHFIFEKTSEQEKLAEFSEIRDQFIKAPRKITALFEKFRSLKKKMIVQGNREIGKLKTL